MMTASIVGLRQPGQTELIHDLSPAQREGGRGSPRTLLSVPIRMIFSLKVSNSI